MNTPRKPDAPDSWPPADGDRSSRKTSETKKNALAILGLFFLIATGLAFFTGRLGITTIADHQIAVLVNYMGGDKEVIETPGIKVYMPALQEIFLFDRTSQEFKMMGDRFVDNNHVPRLTVRANDGSNFYFEELTILYEIIPSTADLLLEDSGSEDGFKKNWIKAYARSILRDEFGRYSAVEAADPSQYGIAAIASKNRLNEILQPHGLRVTKVITPKPKFDAQYEKAIEDRKEADQEVERLKAREEQLVEEKKRSLAAVLKEKEIEMASLLGDLRKQLLTAEQEAIRVQRSADAFSIERKLEGQAFLAERLAFARGLEAKYTKEAEGLTAKAEALEQRGQVVVREALIAKLAGISFTFLPYSRDPEPQRLEHVQLNSKLGSMIDEATLTEDN
ncbi:MAG: SPFH domain-containing protein [Planctomycetota bacterium]|jgi:hypothetical protein|nr:SPFH domain-containing protein [Planctomycetota bacterium]